MRGSAEIFRRWRSGWIANELHGVGVTAVLDGMWKVGAIILQAAECSSRIWVGLAARFVLSGLPQGNVNNSSIRRASGAARLRSICSRRVRLVGHSAVFSRWLNPSFYSALARRFSPGKRRDSIAARVHVRLGRKWRWVRGWRCGMCVHLARRFGQDAGMLSSFCGRMRGLRDAEQKYKGKLRIAQWVTEPARMQPADAARGLADSEDRNGGELAACSD